MHGDWAITNVPFRFGLIGYREREHHAEHDEIVADLAGGLELGYRRFLDFQKVESQNRALVVEQALERVRTQVAGMQQSAHLYRVVTGVKEELKRLGVNFENVSIDLVDLAERP